MHHNRASSVSSTVKLPYFLPLGSLALLMKWKQYVITLFSRFKEENLDISSMSLMFVMHTLCSCCSRGVPSITMLEWGHESSLCSNQDGPFHHWLLCHISSGPVPLDKMSAGLSSEATWCQNKYDVIFWISHTVGYVCVPSCGNVLQPNQNKPRVCPQMNTTYGYTQNR